MKPAIRARLALMMGASSAVVIAACGSSAAPPPPTRTPAPTFTPTPIVQQVPIDPNALATSQAAQAVAQPTAAAPIDQPVTPPADQPVTPATDPNAQPGAVPTIAPPVAPTAAPTVAPQVAAQVTANQIVNVRGGPGTTYNILGSGNQGQTFKVTGKNPAGDWWQIDFNGQPGWVLGELVAAQGTEAIAIAQNIPPAPIVPTQPPPPPATNTPVPAPAAPTEPPKPKYKFNVAVVGRCDRQPAGNWFEGKTYVGGVPQSGYKVVFSYAADAEWITQPQITGPHEGYPGWDQGYYSHIIRPTDPIAGNWFVWVVDDSGQRISEIANWQSTGPGEGCNQAVVDFDSR